MDLPEDIKLDIKKKVEHFLAVGNPASYLQKTGILSIDGEIDYDRANEIFNFIRANEDQLVRAMGDLGMEIKKRNKTGGADQGIIIGN